MYKIIFSKDSKDFYLKAQNTLVKKIHKAIEFLQVNPYKHNNIKALTGKLKSYHRYRVGNYRIVYEIIENKKEVNIILIQKRGDVYK
jgi:mRNA interferase RelE/StbE